MELQRMMAPWSRSALWKDVRLDGLDFVRRCRNTPPGLAPGFLVGAGPAAGGLLFSRRRRLAALPSATIPVECAVPPGAPPGTLLRFPGPSTRFELRRLALEADRPRRARRHIRPRPYQTNPTSDLISCQMAYAHQPTNTEAAMQKRMGSTVKVHSQASRQARAPKVMVLSRNHGSNRKFLRRSNLTALDS